MSPEHSFSDLIRQVRAGDQEAAAELVGRYESVIRRAVRLRLANAKLGSILDSMDIAQSVLASFFVRMAAGEYELDSPEQLVKLLATMARNKLAGAARKEKAERRDHRRTTAVGARAEELASTSPGPGQRLADRELLHEVYRRLSREELQLVDLRNQGRPWADIARQLQANAVVLRKKLSRALDRVTRELGLEVL
jgi:RNA polymerase sigma factor (sigma-70 family)